MKREYGTRQEEIETERAVKRLLAGAKAVGGGAPPAEGGPAGHQPLHPYNIRASPLQPAQEAQPRAASLLQQPTGLACQRLPVGCPPQPSSGVLQRPAIKPLTFDRACASPAAMPLGLPPWAPLHPAPEVLSQSPGWPACSVERRRQPSQEDSSPRGQQLHVLAADVRDAASSGGRVSRNLEALLFLPGAASVNAALATRNRKTELDLGEPSAPAKALVQAFEQLRGVLAGSGGEERPLLMQEAWTALLGRVLRASTSTMSATLQARLLLQPALGGPELVVARAALHECARHADAALQHLPADSAGLAVLEAMHRFAVRNVLPFFPSGGLFCFAWLEHAAWQLCPSLRPAGVTAGLLEHSLQHPHPAMAAVLDGLGAVHEVLEDATRGAPEEQRQAACHSLLLAAGTAALCDHMRPGAAQEHQLVSCLQSMPGGVAVRELADRALQAAALLRGEPNKFTAVAEFAEKGARRMRLAPAGFPQAMWALLSSLQM